MDRHAALGILPLALTAIDPRRRRVSPRLRNGVAAVTGAMYHVRLVLLCGL